MGLPDWTLSARLEGEILDFILGDGRRLAWRSRRPCGLLAAAMVPLPAADLLGTELAEQLAKSSPRVLNIQYEAPLEGIAWESLGLGSAALAEHFALGRQVVSHLESVTAPLAPLADALTVKVVHNHNLPRGPAAGNEDWSSPPGGDDRVAPTTAHVLVLQGQNLTELLAQGLLPQHQCLLVACNPAVTQVVAALDAGVAVLAVVVGDNYLGRSTTTILAGF